MPPTETQTDVQRVGADGQTVDTPTEATSDVLVASIPGDDESKFVTLTLSNPLNERDRIYLGLPADAKTEVGQKVRVNKNGAKAIINAGFATVDPEDNEKVRSVLRGEDPDAGEPTSEPDAEAYSAPAANPPQAQSTPGSGVTGAGKPGSTATQPSAQTGGKAGASGDSTS